MFPNKMLQEMRDLQKLLDHDERLYEFLSKKGLIRINKHQLITEEQQKKKKADKFTEDLNYYRGILDNIEVSNIGCNRYYVFDAKIKSDLFETYWLTIF